MVFKLTPDRPGLCTTERSHSATERRFDSLGDEHRTPSSQFQCQNICGTIYNRDMRMDEFGMGFREYAILESVSMDIIYLSFGRDWSRWMRFEISRTRHINSYTAHLWIYETNNVNPSNG